MHHSGWSRWVDVDVILQTGPRPPWSSVLSKKCLLHFLALGKRAACVACRQHRAQEQAEKPIRNIDELLIRIVIVFLIKKLLEIYGMYV